jgi:hypothetical protein
MLGAPPGVVLRTPDEGSAVPALDFGRELVATLAVRFLLEFLGEFSGRSPRLSRRAPGRSNRRCAVRLGNMFHISVTMVEVIERTFTCQRTRTRYE